MQPNLHDVQSYLPKSIRFCIFATAWLAGWLVHFGQPVQMLYALCECENGSRMVACATIATTLPNTTWAMSVLCFPFLMRRKNCLRLTKFTKLFIELKWKMILHVCCVQARTPHIHRLLAIVLADTHMKPN